MKIVDVVQGTEEWLECRTGIPTASNFSKLVTTQGKLSKSLNNYALQLASELLVDELEESFRSEYMDIGNEREGDAVAAYQEATHTVVDRAGIMT